MLVSAPVTSADTKNVTIAEDTIYAVGHPVDDGSNKKRLVALGDQYTYLIDGEIEKLEMMVNDLDPESLVMRSRIQLLRKNRGKPDEYFFGYLYFDYIMKNVAYSDSEKQSLDRMCFPQIDKRISSDQARYLCRVDVRINLYKPADATVMDLHRLSKGRKIQLYVKEMQASKTNPSKVVDKLFWLPFAVAFDVVTAPVQAAVLLDNMNEKNRRPIK